MKWLVSVLLALVLFVSTTGHFNFRNDFAWDVTVTQAAEITDGFSWAQLANRPLDGVGDSLLVP